MNQRSKIAAAVETIKAQRDEIERLKAAGDGLCAALSRAKVWDCDSYEFKALTTWQQLTKKGE